VRSFQREAQEKGLLLSIESDGSDPPSVMLDPVRLRQVLTNLIGNAIKFTAKGEVQVTMRALPNSLNTAVSLAFSVRDTGIGFATEQSTRLFDPFIQGDGSITRSFGGTGLGLAISRNLVRLMGGDIHAIGKVNQGATFSFEIKAPLAPACDTHMLEASTGLTDPALPVLRQHILVVEDHAINLKLACLLLDRMGHTYQTAANGQEALQLLTEQAFDMVVLDVMMPVLDGMSTLKALRQWPNSPLTSMPVIMVTARDEDADIVAGLEVGADDYMTKPFSARVLSARVRAVLGRRRVVGPRDGRRQGPGQDRRLRGRREGDGRLSGRRAAA
jgi:CheY-like chemotaxis protein